jgi:hypothetical protein
MPMEKMANRLLDLIKGTNLYTQEWINMDKYNKANGCRVKDEKDCVLRHYFKIYNLKRSSRLNKQ